MPRLAERTRQSCRTPRLHFAAIEVTGALLPPEIVTRSAAFDMPEQSQADYGLLPGLKLRDEIARYYQVAVARWGQFVAMRDGHPPAPHAFVLDLLRDCFGFADIRKAGAVVMSGRQFPIPYASHDGKVPLVVAPLAPQESRKAGIDETLPVFGEEGRRRSATQLLQDYLNASDKALWGLVTDGSTLRLMRDNASLTRPAWIEADLEKIFSDGLFAEFSALWSLIHASRFGPAASVPSDCPLERWRERGQIDGSAAKDMLRLGVEAALLELGCGFLEEPANLDLRQALQAGELTRQAYFEQLLRLVYRLIFLFAAEDRGLLHVPGTPNTAAATYRRGYSVGRLRERCTKNTEHDRHHDAWNGLRALFGALARGAPDLGLTALGGLFAPGNLPDLAAARLTNRRLLKAVWRLSWFRPAGQPMTRVNWRDMQTEELGSVYESLLELIPIVHLEARAFSFTHGDAANRGSERKTTGTYYTPDSLVQLLLTTTLDPVLDAAEARNPEDPVSEILKLSFVDPACGSGHFLLSAARRAAAHVARHLTSDAPGQEVYQHALREVVSNCIYGVDRNPMAVELCKVALWIEALEPGRPLSFLDARIRCGDSLIGVFDYRSLLAGLPDAAFEPLTGDDKAVAKAWKDLNKAQRGDPATPGLLEHMRAPASIADGAARVLAMPEDTIEQTRAKSGAWERLFRDPQRLALKKACDLYVAAFLLPKSKDRPHPDADSQALPTTEAVWRMLRAPDGGPDLPAEWTGIIEANRVFHWPLEFPAVMASGGFDAVVGNPPWERIKLQEQEFFAALDEEIATAPNKAARDRMIRRLKDAEPGTPQARLGQDFESAKRASESASVFVRKTGRYPLTGTGDVNTYALFAEHFSRLVRTPALGVGRAAGRQSSHGLISRLTRHAGRAGVIVPTGIATDSSTSAFFGDLVAGNRLSALYDFENREKLFSAVDSRVKFSILAIGPSNKAHFAAFLLNTQALEEKDRRIELEADDFRLMNPNTLTAPLFRGQADRELTRKLYRAAPVLIRERPDHPDGDDNPWGVTFQRLFDMSNDSRHFRTAAQLDAQNFHREGTDWNHDDGRHYVPLYEAKMIHHFDNRFGSYAGLEARPSDGSLPETPDAVKNNPDHEAEPWYWVPADETALRLARVPSRLKQYFRKDNAEGCLKVLAEWMLGALDPEDLNLSNLSRTARHAENRLRDVLGIRALERNIVGAKVTTWLAKTAPNARKMQRETLLSEDDLAFIQEAPSDPLELTGALIDHKQPRWLMGWRDITNATNERTVIATVFPRTGVGHTAPLAFVSLSAAHIAVFIAQLSSLTIDYAARQKLAGTHLTYFYLEQLPILAAERLTSEDHSFVAPRVMELTYTSWSMKPWAEDLGYAGPPFGFCPDRRAQLRAELDAFFARKYGLTRDELRYVLDPADIKGDSYPSETFRGLKRNEMEQFGEYRTRRLVLEAFDRLTGA